MEIYGQLQKSRIVLLLMALLPLGSWAQAELVLAQGGQSSYQICIENEAAREAAQELQHYWSRLLGELPPIAWAHERGSSPALRLRIAGGAA
ncbi:hypothetical protein RZS08_13210, partial [Arthrospira platensis SPKY1]|nr:hypothetical protein [Arthrospira platensis SPKY1]